MIKTSENKLKELASFFPVDEFIDNGSDDAEFSEIVKFFKSVKGQKILDEIENEPTITLTDFLKELHS